MWGRESEWRVPKLNPELGRQLLGLSNVSENLSLSQSLQPVLAVVRDLQVEGGGGGPDKNVVKDVEQKNRWRNPQMA